jgi:site-specific recombinase XerD
VITYSVAIAFKDSLVKDNIKSKTINDSYISCLKSLFAYGVKSGRNSNNPFLKVESSGGPKPDDIIYRPYFDDEIASVVAKCLEADEPLRKWLPLITVTSGARIAELSQLWAGGKYRISRCNLVHRYKASSRWRIFEGYKFDQLRSYA